ncbi:hypothetical protein [Pararhodobacter zhoushanensis]|uniref:Uncharacterized protein n=1 Tax=Pararhodobacter zhoushanensis TaxID=2479545 RepID=A0ABT3GW27_9RHOB|nr:hypothetical protein [Pararhodobacter zhoushanensis]MCW1931732.1 hypothetical protein [Pararhodobacter zhoushanensis]
MRHATFHQSVPLPLPFGRLDFFSLIEPERETETEYFFRHRLYLKSACAEGGKVLIKQSPEYAVPKFVPGTQTTNPAAD